MRPPEEAARRRAGWLGALVVLLLYGGLALNVDVPAASGGIFSDEATYYLMGHSLALDGDLEYRREDLERVYREFPSGPAGVFLKRGTDVTGFRLTATAPFFEFRGIPDQDQARLYYGKSFIYPLAAAPFVWLFGTNGFLLLNALLMAAAFLIAYSVSSRMSGTTNGMLIATAFVFATVVPVYAVWMTPELFNLVLGLAAYYLWLRPYLSQGAGTEVPADIGPAPDATEAPTDRRQDVGRDFSPGGANLSGDLLAAAVIGVATFSKVTNVLLVVPILAWQVYRREWMRALATGIVCASVAAALFGANVAVSGDWNYQGGPWGRGTCYETPGFPFQQEGVGFEVCEERARNEALGSVIFDPEVFWSNLRANLRYFFVGRNSGLVAYFFPAVFGMLAVLLGRGRRQPWQWFVLGGVMIQILLFVITLPNTYFGSGGSVGNRYFMGVYGICLFLIPSVRSRLAAIVPWIAGAAFMAELVLNPFYTSLRPFEHQKAGLFRLLPVERTNVNDLPLMNQRERNFWWGEHPDALKPAEARAPHPWWGLSPDLGHPGFQIFFLDDNSYLQEADRLSLWIRGGSRAEWLVRTVNPVSRLRLYLRAGPVATSVTVNVEGTSQRVDLAAGGNAEILFELPPGFPYKHERPEESPGPTYVWSVWVSSTNGFTPALVEAGSPDVRYLGVLVTPYVIP